MLDLLIKYARDHDLVIEPGFKPKLARWGLVFDVRGRFQGVHELGDAASKKNRGRRFDRCPDLSQPEMKAAGDGCRHFLLDSAQVVTLYEADSLTGKDADKIKSKHEFFVDLLRQASSSVPELDRLAATLSDERVLGRINQELSRLKAKPTENATLALSDPLRFIVDSDAWHDWWRSFRKSLAGNEREREANRNMLCLATGEVIEPAATHPKIEGLSDVGGLAMGDALVSFKQNAFRSFGLDKSANAAMSAKVASTYRAALNDLIRNQAHKLAGVKVVHWFSGTEPVPPEEDPFGMINDPSFSTPDDPATKTAAQSQAGKLLKSIKSGERAYLLGYRFYSLTLSANSGRVVIRDWMEGQFEELASAVDHWFNDLVIVRRDGAGLTPPPKFLAVVAATVRELADAQPSMVAALWRAALRATSEIPTAAMAQSLGRIRTEIVDPDSVPNHARYGLIKAYLIRKGDTSMSVYLNENHPDAAYQCGRLMAVLAAIQKTALPEVGAGIVQRYYAAASATPALVLGRLFRTAQFHLDKIRGDRPKLASWFDVQLANVAARLNPESLPATLTLHQQCLFALGYYQQKAARNGGENSDESNRNVAGG